MTPEESARALAEQRARAEELARTHEELRERRAQVGDFSAEVHEQAARVHERLGDRSRLDPDALRQHAQQDRDMAREERAALAVDQQDDAAGT